MATELTRDKYKNKIIFKTISWVVERQQRAKHCVLREAESRLLQTKLSPFLTWLLRKLEFLIPMVDFAYAIF
jgi:hypothetical protein